MVPNRDSEDGDGEGAEGESGGDDDDEGFESPVNQCLIRLNLWTSQHLCRTGWIRLPLSIEFGVASHGRHSRFSAALTQKRPVLSVLGLCRPGLYCWQSFI